MRHRVCKEDYAWYPSTCTYYKCDKDWEIGKYLKEPECMKSLVGNLRVTRDKIVDTPENVLINPSDGIDYGLLLLYEQSQVYYCLWSSLLSRT